MVSSTSNNVMQKNIALIGGARCFHTMDKLRAVQKAVYPGRVPFLTDLIKSESFDKLIKPGDDIIRLFVIDRFYLRDNLD